jgi:hypothetical protein
MLEFRTGSISDDGAVNFDLGNATKFGHAIITTGTTGEYALVGFKTSSTAFCFIIAASSDFAVTTGALTGTTGTDTKSNVSVHTNGKIYIENRRGSARNYYLSICAP